MIGGSHVVWGSPVPDVVITYGLGAVIALLLLGAPKQVWRSLKRWGDDSPKPPGPRVSPVSAQATAQLLARVRRLVRPTLLLTPSREATFSKLGGDPDLPADVAWPAADQGLRTFLGQMDLAAFGADASIDWLPEQGRLYLFYDPDRHGFTDVVRVLFNSEPAGPPTSAPGKPGRRFPERRVAFERFISAPSPEWLRIDLRELDVDFAALGEGLGGLVDAPTPAEIQHRIGGYPNEIQDECMPLSCEHLARGLPPPVWGEAVPPAIDRASKEWRLLIQIDSDPALKMSFGDGGRLYVFIRERHARAGDFSKTVTLWQTY
jgi:hypothetical protein